MKKKYFTNVTEIYSKSSRQSHNTLQKKTTNLSGLQHTFRQLEELNRILKQILPDNLTNVCHVGAIDDKKNTVVIFVTNQMAIHILRNFTNQILQAFINAHFNFDKVLFRTSKYETSL